MLFIEVARLAISSVPRTCMRLSRSPPAMRPATSRATRSGTVTCRITVNEMTASASSSSAPVSHSARRSTCSICDSV